MREPKNLFFTDNGIRVDQDGYIVLSEETLQRIADKVCDEMEARKKDARNNYSLTGGEWP